MTNQTLTMDDFWATIEAAWATVNDRNNARARLLDPDADGDARLKACMDLDPFCVWDAHCERALYDLDRADVHAATDGGDDGFLYCRGWIVACGRAYYEAVNREPETYAIEDAECEEMCYFGAHVHQDRFGEWVKKTEISRETGSNKDGWKE